jgi:2'-5' RNA ligase
VRCFIALGTESSPGRELEAWLGTTRAAFPELSVARPESLHVTLHFLGELRDQDASAAAGALAVAAEVAPGAGWLLRYGDAGVFPSRSRPRVLWLGAGDDGGRLTATRTAMGEALMAVGTPIEERPYRPHLTLARVRRHGLDGERLGALLRHLEGAPVPAPSPARSLLLYRSILGAGGSRHEVLSEVPLSGH